MGNFTSKQVDRQSSPPESCLPEKSGVATGETLVTGKESLKDLPQSLLEDIFIQLTSENQIALGQTCKSLLHLSYQPSVLEAGNGSLPMPPVLGKHIGLRDDFLSRIENGSLRSCPTLQSLEQDKKETVANLAVQRILRARTYYNSSRGIYKVASLQGHGGQIRTSAFSPNGKKVVTASYDGTARVWDLMATPPAAVVLRGNGGELLSAAFSPNGKKLVTAPAGGTAQVWDLTTTPPAAVVLPGDDGPVMSAAFSPNGEKVVTTYIYSIARVWDLTTTPPAAVVLRGYGGGLGMTVAFSPNEEKLLTASIDGPAQIWDLAATPPNEVEL